ncbi:hypothetical protein [Nocardia sp. NPDC050413]|uniref:hypothetical protein n=1 Tax=Nocardia sp. NPDC050413 TaxID=3155784 RepID=UPI0033E812B9
MSRWIRWITAGAVGVVPIADWVVRGYGPAGWMFAFFIFFGAPVWLGCLGAGLWIAKGLVVDARFLSASRVRQGFVVLALWVHLLSLTLFCWFLADGGDNAAWQSPVSKMLGVDSEGSAAPEWLKQMSEIGLISMPAAALSMLAAWAAYMGRPLLHTSPRQPPPTTPRRRPDDNFVRPFHDRGEHVEQERARRED